MRLSVYDRTKFSTLGSIIEISPQGPIISFVFDEIIRNLLGFNETILYKAYNLSPNPVDTLSFDNMFLQCHIAKGMIFRGRRSDIIHKWTMTVDPGYESFGKIAGGVVWYVRQNEDFVSSISFKLTNEINKLVPFNGQSISLRLPIKKIYFSTN